MIDDSVEKVSQAITTAQDSGDLKLVAAIRHDINVTMLSFKQIVAKYKL